MKIIILLLLLKIIYNFENEEMYFKCEKPKGCKNWYINLVGCDMELYSFKLNTTDCEKMKGKIDYFFCDNYVEKDEEFTLESCSPSQDRGCSNIPCFDGKGMIREILECIIEDTDKNHIKHKYYPNYYNYSIIKKEIDFGIPQQLKAYDNGKIFCSFETLKGLIDYLVWTVKDKFVYTDGGGHNSDFYGSPSKGTGEKCPNDVNVTGFDSSGLVLYIMRMLGNKVNLGGSDCQKIYVIAKRLGLIKSEDSIKEGDVLLFGSDEYKSHAAIAISREEALEAYKHYDEDCTGMPISTRRIKEITSRYKNGKVYVVDFLKKKTFTDGEKYLRDENVTEVYPIVVKSIYNYYCYKDLCYYLVKSIAYSEGNQISSFVLYIIISKNKRLRNLEENLKIKFFCDFNSSEKNENISELIINNYNCSTEPNENLNITDEDIIESFELENKEEESYYDISNINKRMNIKQISKKESNFNIDNLKNYLIFICSQNKTINLTNETSFILEGKTNRELSEDIYLTLSFNNYDDFHMNCLISMNDSNLYCSFNFLNLKADNYSKIYSIKENDISTNGENIFLVGLNKVGFIYEKKEKGKIKMVNIKLIIIVIAIILVVIFIIVFAFLIIRINKKRKTLGVKIEPVKNCDSNLHNEIRMNGSSRDNN